MDITEEHVAAAQLRMVLDEKLGRATPEWVRRIATTSPAGKAVAKTASATVPGSGDRDASAIGRYLEAITKLADTGVVPTRTNVAERVGDTVPAANTLIVQLQRDGLVVDDPAAGLQLTAVGQRARVVIPKPLPDLEITLPALTGGDELNGLVFELTNQMTTEFRSEAEGYWRMVPLGDAGLRVIDLSPSGVEVVMRVLKSWVSENPHQVVQVRRGEHDVELRAGQESDAAALAAALVRNH
ncbi:hypothetical protein C8D87_103190 [Lentzea atacamensis]|uniref:Uncharacterized protein n=1 Tax=Lentzea atacamensis TaxID=531938 RepID=A0ABX9E9M1_9PSEU|nr:hypothetical protein [Lentzea atacamensis]RAS66851.1 hypothetical protein C8D87_103190 [Lentzea atacamensis]